MAALQVAPRGSGGALLGARGLDGETTLYGLASGKQDRDGLAAIGFSRARYDTTGAEGFAKILSPATARFNRRGGFRLRGSCSWGWILDMPRNDAGHDFQGRHTHHVMCAWIDARTSAGLELPGALKSHRHEAELVLLGCGLADQRRRSSNVA